MTLVARLARHLLDEHPDRAAAVLERSPLDDAARLIGSRPPAVAAEVVRRMSPHLASAVLAGLDPQAAAGILEALPFDASTRLARRIEPQQRERILERVTPRRARGMRSSLEFPERTAGALMDPDVLALPQDLSAQEALTQIRGAAEQARYNLYVVDREQRLVGALNLRELLIARGSTPLSTLMVGDPHRVLATDDRAAVLTHPGWKEVHSLPVVDEANAYLGAIRYRTLREIEEELSSRTGDEDASSAFAQLITAGAEGLLDALAGAARRPSAVPSRGDRNDE